MTFKWITSNILAFANENLVYILKITDNNLINKSLINLQRGHTNEIEKISDKYLILLQNVNLVIFDYKNLIVTLITPVIYSNIYLINIFYI